MLNKSLAAGGVLAGALVVSAAVAAPGVASGNVNMRTGPGTGYSIITTIPVGAPIEVFECGSWCKVGYAGTQGFVSANYVGSGYTDPAPRAYYEPVPVYETPVYEAPLYDQNPIISSYYPYPWVVAPRHRYIPRGHYRRGDGAYFEFNF
jgi:uncharacterized protein YraI